jgi:Galactose oxidase, central domain/Kelch motif
MKQQFCPFYRRFRTLGGEEPKYMKIPNSLGADLSATSILGWRIAFPLLFLGAGLVLIQPCAGGSGVFANTGSLLEARAVHTATLLPNGKVLVAGGAINGGNNSIASAELYDPASGTWTATGSLTTARTRHTATLLPNGKVLVAGGFNDHSGGVRASAELYDPASGIWTATGTLASGRYFHTVTLLPNGKVLVAGGRGTGGILASAELYDPASGTWTTTGSLAANREAHTATLLPNGKVLVAGGSNGIGLVSAELYDPASGTWAATGSLINTHGGATETLLPDGKVLVVGLFTGAELYDPASGTWAATGSPAIAHGSHTATLLPNGKVLVAGSNSVSNQAGAELYDPASGTWSATGSLATGRFSQTATLLPNGKALLAGGSNSNISGNLASAELYGGQPTATPAQLLNISTRLGVLTDPNQLIGGFIVTGTEPKRVIILATGPSLAAFGIPGVLANPTLELFQDNTSVASNDDWKIPAQAEIEATGLQPTNDLECALVRTLAPGSYTAIVRGANGGTGVGTVQVFDLAQTANSKLANISSRGFVDTGANVMIAGFILGGANGATNSRVVIRAIGPSLNPFLSGALQDPTLELKDANGSTLRSNDDWKLDGQQAEIEAAGLAPTDDHESALVTSLPSGSFTATVRGKSGTTGVAVVQVYNVP